jgi:molecular chaperone Hsp33
MNRRDGVAAAGGMIIQAFPHATGDAISAIEKSVKEAPSFSKLLETMPIEEAVATVLQGTGYKQIDAGYSVPVAYACQCSRERALAPLALLGRDEIEEMIGEGGTEVVCQFCGRKYQFSPEDLFTLMATHEA